jgi:NADPH:quinone reductase-like Zn-dependent oxidoreductase
MFTITRNGWGGHAIHLIGKTNYLTPSNKWERNPTMKAIICTAYGSPEVLKLKEVEKPQLKTDQILIRVHATTVSRADLEIRSFRFSGLISIPLRLYFGLFKPRLRILGEDFSGVVEAVGKNETSFSVGDRVCGTSGIGLGAYAEYLCVGGVNATSVLAKIPEGMPFNEAAAVPYGGLEALGFLRKGNIQKDQKILIIGAGGSFGTYAVQLAKYFGSEVTAVDSGGKLEMLHAIGADHVIDYTIQDYTKLGEVFDLVFDVICKIPLEQHLRLLRPGGTCLLANPQDDHFWKGFRANRKKDKKVVFGVEGGSEEDLTFILELVATGKIKPIIDRIYTLEEMVEAHRYAETEQKKGNIVITVRDENADR